MSSKSVERRLQDVFPAADASQIQDALQRWFAPPLAYAGVPVLLCKMSQHFTLLSSDNNEQLAAAALIGRGFQLKVSEKRVRTSSPSRLPVSAMTRVELMAELTLAVPHSSFQPAAPRNSHSRHSELGVQDRDDVKKARSQHDLGVILETERDKKDAFARAASQSAPGGRPAPATGAPSSSVKKKIHVESPSVSPPRSDPLRPDVAHELLKHIASLFPQQQSVMQNLATAEQCYEHIVLLLSQAKQSHNVPQTQFVQYLGESTVQLMLKMDLLQVQDECQRSFRKRLLLSCEKTAEDCRLLVFQIHIEQANVQRKQLEQKQQHGQQPCMHKPLIFAHHPHVEGGDGQHDDHVFSAAVSDLEKAHHVQLHHVPVAEHSWRGKDVDKSSDAFAIANAIISRAQSLCFEASLPVSGIQAITKFFGMHSKKLLGTNPSIVAADLEILSRECIRLFSCQPMVVAVHGDTKVFGDIHGQLTDLLALFREHGFPSNRSGGDVELASYVFNGDFVDRGEQQVEVVALLLSLKVCFPDRVFLVRGNHEFRDQNVCTTQSGLRGFDLACTQFFGSQAAAGVFESIHSAFDWLPFAALIEDSVLVVHGGIGSGLWSVGTEGRPDIDWLDSKGQMRPLKSTDPSSVEESLKPRFTHLHNIVWSDPLGQSHAPDDWRPHYQPNTGRGAGVDAHGKPMDFPIKSFSDTCTKQFCNRNRISMVIRSHEVKKGGYELHHNGLLCTVFSARNYAGAYKNDAALVLLQPDEKGRIHCKFKTLKHLE